MTSSIPDTPGYFQAVCMQNTDTATAVADFMQVGRIRDAIKPWEYDRLYGAFTRIDADAAGTVQRSADRYIGILNGTFRRNYF